MLKVKAISKCHQRRSKRECLPQQPETHGVRAEVWQKQRRLLGWGTAMEPTQEATEESKRTITVFKEEYEVKLGEFLRDNELLV